MVSIAPNQFKIEGIITAKQTEKELADHVTLVVQLDKVEHLQGPEEFLDSSTKLIAVTAKTETAASLKKGMRLACKIRKAPGHFFVLPDSIEAGE